MAELNETLVELLHSRIVIVSSCYLSWDLLLFRWELVGSVSHCRAGAGVAVCSSHVSQIRDVGQGSSNVVNCM